MLGTLLRAEERAVARGRCRRPLVVVGATW
jgi:hypothetical protein